MVHDSDESITTKNVAPVNNGRRIRQFTEAQLVIMGIWLGLPIVAFLLLLLLNPGYEQELFGTEFIVTKAMLLGGSVIGEVVNAAALYVGFRMINRFLPLETSRRLLRATLISLLSVLTFLVFTLPVLSIALFGPAWLILMRHEMPNP